jgi:hypothetical protein
MTNAAWIGFVVAATLAFGFFLFWRRHFDLLTIAYSGALFYFSPLFWGRVLQSSPDLDSTIPPAVYSIATAYVLALVLAGIISTPFDRDYTSTAKAARLLSGWYLVLAVFGLVGSFISSRGAILNADKVEALKQVGYFYVLFEVAASLACISAVVERRGWIVAGSTFLLVVDLLVGFRVFAVLTGLSVAVVMLMRDGRIRLFTKAPTYGSAAVLVIVAMLLVHTARFAIFDQIAALQGAPRILKTQEMRGDILQYNRTTTPPGLPLDSTDSSTSATAKSAASEFSRWLAIPLDLLQRSEPWIVEATLAGIVQRGVSCSPSNIFKSFYLLTPPGFTRLVPNTFPPTFYDEYKPILYPNITYGTGGNIWAEMLCRFGYVGVAIFAILLILTLIGLHILLRKASPAAAAPIAFGGVILAFYINRNDLHYTLVLLRQTAIVFVLAYGLSLVWHSSLKLRLRNIGASKASRSVR